MVSLFFHVAGNRYAINASKVVEVLPLVHWKRFPRPSTGLAGIFDYHGTAIPLVDLTDLMTGKSSRNRMSTRIIVVNREKSHASTNLVGLLVEQVTETLRHSPNHFRSSDVVNPATEYLGRVSIQPSGIIQYVDLENLPFERELPEEVEHVSR